MIDYGFGVTLRPLDELSLRNYFDARNEPAIYRWCRQIGPLDWENHKAWFYGLKDRPDVRMFDVEGCGVCGLTGINHHARHAEFRLYINKEHQMGGLGKKALLTLCGFGFWELNLNMIWGETVGENPAGKMFKKVGFDETGHRPDFYYKEGMYQKSHLYCLRRVKWDMLHQYSSPLT